MKVPGNPAGMRGKPGHGYGAGVGVRLDSPVRAYWHLSLLFQDF